MREWYNYRHTRLAGTMTKANPYKTMLQALQKPANSVPKKASLIQTYLSTNKTRINEIYSIHAATAEKKGIVLRIVIAKELYATEDEATKAEWVQKVEALRETANKEFAEAKKGEPSNDPAVQEE